MASLRSSILRFLIRKTVDWNKPLAEVRADLERLNSKAGLPSGVGVSAVSAGGVRAEWLEPAGAPSDKAILYLHGGGYCLGIVNANRGFVAKMAGETGLKVLLADYRLAPENPFPAALEDAIAAYRWLLGEGYAPGNIVCVADSSGCGLTLAALMTLREDNTPLPAAMILLSPMADLTGSGESMESRKAADPFQYRDPLCIARNYVGGRDPRSPLLSPLLGDLRGLPPMLIHGSDCDVFLSDAVRLAEKARLSGVEARLKIWDKMWHIFQMSAGILPEANRALKEISAYIKEKIG